MKTKKVLTANLKPGMILSEAAYTYTNHLIIPSNTELDEDLIEKMKYYAIKSIRIFLPDDEDETSDDLSESISAELSYYERIQHSKEFKAFSKEFDSSVELFKTELNNMVVQNSDGIVDTMLEHVHTILGKTRNPLHLLDMMQCIRGYDDMTYAHSMNVALICNVIGQWLHLTDSDLTTLTIAGLLHDIGKLKVPPDIIKKPGKLTDDEFKLIRMHPKYGYDILKPKNLDNRVKLAALQHHERYDGTGYPRKLPGNEVEYFSHIVAVADVYDAMTSDRCYRKGMCPFHVLEQLECDKDAYEPQVLYKFVSRTVEAYINTEVMLSTGEKGKVVLLNQNFLSRPTVITEDKTYDLSKNFDVQITTLL